MELNRIRKYIGNLLISTNWGYKRFLRKKYNLVIPARKLDISKMKTVLQSQSEVEFATSELRRNGFITHEDTPKNWDMLIAIQEILDRHSKSAVILDAGGELYSRMAQNLFLFGFRNIFVGNLVFSKPFNLGSIRYEPCDITKSRFKNGFFDAITCLSVIEHGVEWSQFFKEMSRVIKPGGTLIISTDFFCDKVDTEGLSAYDSDVLIFDTNEIKKLVRVASSHDLELASNLDMECKERVVTWSRLGLSYTFIILIFIRK